MNVTVIRLGTATLRMLKLFRMALQRAAPLSFDSLDNGRPLQSIDKSLILSGRLSLPDCAVIPVNLCGNAVRVLSRDPAFGEAGTDRATGP